MQNTLINVSERGIGNGSVQTVNARELHEFLEVGKVFAAWIQERIEQYGFAENVDFVCFPISESKGRGGRNRKEYALTLDMAKELAMVERNEKGKQARQYFIECERRLRNNPQPPQPPRELTRLEMIEQMLQIEREKLAIAAQVQTLAPKAAALDRIATTVQGALCITNAAKSLQVAPRALFQYLQTNDWIYKRPNSANWIAYQQRLKQGYMEQKVVTISRSDGTDKLMEQALITPKGLAQLAQVFAAQLAA